MKKNNEVEISYIKCLKADIYRVIKDSSIKKIIINALLNRTFRPIFTMRMCQHFNEKIGFINKIALFVFKILHRLSCEKAGLDLNWKTQIGPGFCLTHGWGTVINPNTIIGSNVTIFNGVTIGQKDTIKENNERISGFPVIQDNVWIGANSVIIGSIIIGTSSVIAPLSMVFNDVEPNTTVGCNPQKILKLNSVEDVYNKAPI